MYINKFGSGHLQKQHHVNIDNTSGTSVLQFNRITGSYDANDKHIVNVLEPSDANDDSEGESYAVNRRFVDHRLASVNQKIREYVKNEFLSKSDIKKQFSNFEQTHYQHIKSEINNLKDNCLSETEGSYDAVDRKIINLSEPQHAADATTKFYVDRQIASALEISEFNFREKLNLINEALKKLEKPTPTFGVQL